MNEEIDMYNEFIKKLSVETKKHDPIDPDLYQKYDVKRGLRYADGRGVLVGLTRIGDVVGYEIDSEGKKVAVPGRLVYRGYSVEAVLDRLPTAEIKRKKYDDDLGRYVYEITAEVYGDGIEMWFRSQGDYVIVY